MVTFLFSVPFLIFSMPGGWLADRFSKRQSHDLDQGDGVRLHGGGDGRAGDALADALAGGP